jgi:CheY-like chemotaxis protein
MRILIVDDHEISRAALRALMRTEGIDVTDVRTGDAAITAAIAFHPDVVIVDVAPADPVGFLIARRLQALPDAPHVVLTSSSNQCRFGPQLDSHLFIAKAGSWARKPNPGQSDSVPGRWGHGPFGIGLFIRTDPCASLGPGPDAAAGRRHAQLVRATAR